MGVERFFNAGLEPESEGHYQEKEKYYRIKFDRFAEKLRGQKSTLIRAFQHSYKTYAVFPFEHPKPNIYREDDLYYEEHPHYLDLLPEAKYQQGFDLPGRLRGTQDLPDVSPSIMELETRREFMMAPGALPRFKMSCVPFS